MKKVVYWGNVKDCPRPTPDQEVLKALKKYVKTQGDGNEVRFFDIKNFDMGKLIKVANESDLFLFHGQVPTADEVTSMLMIERIQIVLRTVTCKKVLWFMEKVWMGKGTVLERLLPEVDFVFLTDGTWVRRVKENVHFLPCAASVKPLRGKYRKEFACDITYMGQMYGTRIQEYEFLKEHFGDGIKFFNDKFGQDFADLCRSAKIVLIPSFPFDDFFWSDRIYSVLAAGGLVVQRRTYGLKEEGFIDGQHYFEYEKEFDFFALVNSLLEKSMDKIRNAIARNGKEFVKQHTYLERIKELIRIVYGEVES